MIALCAIAVAASIRRLVALSHPALSSAPSAMVALDALFVAKATLTRSHVIGGLVLALAIPFQLSAAVRARAPAFHRWLDRILIGIGLAIGLSGYAMVMAPVGGALEVSAIAVYGSAFIAALLVGWSSIRAGNVTRHREWMLRAVAIVLGIAATRPVVGAFFATSSVTGLSPSEFFGAAFWIGFTSTMLAGEWYIRHTRHPSRPSAATSARLTHPES